MQDKVVKVSDGWSEISPYLPSIWRACLTIAMFVLNVCKVLLLNVCHYTELPRVRTAQEKRREVSQIWKLQPVLIPLKRSPCQHSRLWWILVRSFSVVVQGWLGWEESSNRQGGISWEFISLQLHWGPDQEENIYQWKYWVPPVHCFSYN